MKLSKLLRQVTYRVVKGTEDVEILGIQSDSRLVRKRDVFVCIYGYETDGHRFFPEAVRKGASAVIVQQQCPGCGGCRACREFLREGKEQDLTVVEVEDTRYALALMAAAYYGYPAKELKMVGITGTKGKTTTAYMIREGLLAAGHRAGLIGTVQIDTGKRIFSCSNTTPESLQIQKYLREMADAGCDSVVMEVSSQALKLHRTVGIEFDVAVFTNLGKDHIGPGEHADMKEYLECKRRLFFQCVTAVGNADDEHLAMIWRDTGCSKITYGMAKAADYHASNVRFLDENGTLGICCRIDGSLNGELRLAMPGRFNVFNGLAAVAVLRELKIPERVIFKALAEVRVPGRMEALPGLDGCRILIDYAHNAMSLQKSLETLREYEPKRLIVIFGCGGNRSRERRFMMGETAGRYADYTIITTDNPRYEVPQAIIKDIEWGIQKTEGAYRVIADRQEAVCYAIRTRKPGDVILIAGKGHETYQEIRGVKFPMDDRELVRKCTQILS